MNLYLPIFVQVISSLRSDYSCKLDLSDNKHCGKVNSLQCPDLLSASKWNLQIMPKKSYILSALWWNQCCETYFCWRNLFLRALVSGWLLWTLYQTVALRGSGPLPTQSLRWDWSMTESSVYVLVQVKCGGEKSQLSQVRYFEMKISTFTSIFGISLFSCR